MRGWLVPRRDQRTPGPVLCSPIRVLESAPATGMPSPAASYESDRLRSTAGRSVPSPTLPLRCTSGLLSVRLLTVLHLHSPYRSPSTILHSGVAPVGPESWSLAVRDRFAGLLATVPQWSRCRSEPISVRCGETPYWNDERCCLAGQRRSWPRTLAVPYCSPLPDSCDLSVLRRGVSPSTLGGVSAGRGVEPLSLILRVSAVHSRPVGFPSRPVCYSRQASVSLAPFAAADGTPVRTALLGRVLSLRCSSPQWGASPV
jgi:hypothetical protein